jgi:hypothetical protein
LAGTNEAQPYQAVAPPSNDSFDVSKETASQLQDISDDDVVNSQQRDGSAKSACDNVMANSDLQKPSLNMKSRFKFLSGMVNRTLAVKRRVQVVSLKSVVDTHSSWSSTSQGYQNLFEFGTLVHSPCLFVLAFSFIFMTHPKHSAAFMLLFLAVLSFEMQIADSFTVNHVHVPLISKT